MSRTNSEAERAPAVQPALASHYRAIGPAAIVAALLCAPKKVEDTPATADLKKAA